MYGKSLFILRNVCDYLNNVILATLCMSNTSALIIIPTILCHSHFIPCIPRLLIKLLTNFFILLDLFLRIIFHFYFVSNQ